jgi:hypothetical protein
MPTFPDDWSPSSIPDSFVSLISEHIERTLEIEALALELLLRFLILGVTFGIDFVPSRTEQGTQALERIQESGEEVSREPSDIWVSKAELSRRWFVCVCSPRCLVLGYG